MEIDSFAQCLAYISATTKSNGLVGFIIPTITSLTCVIIGFALNQFSSTFKTNKDSSNKIMCITEDIERLQHDAESIFKAALLFLDSHRNTTKPGAQKIPTKLSTPHIDKYFVEVAHLLSKEKRDNIARVLPLISHINDIKKDLGSSNVVDNVSTHTRVCKNVISSVIKCVESCDGYLNGSPEFQEDWISLAEKLKVRSDFIEDLVRAGLQEPLS